ncbi:hypothetical protein CYMTET_49467 [Cymbomonas tetramitiformis]|uniref:Uncharacterized protein n=1 Tax=Cymbomonas tetramitiformis TaxID=36881 RepID=A0AAE0ETV3_9CHLO|nr:hypothetical protein CYMTET_49467 [Cymbomonas tetramitiformis]
MVSRNDHLIIWTSSVVKTKLQKLRQYLKVSPRMRMDSWKKQRQQVLDWVGSSLPDLQLLPEDVRQRTEVLMEADLLAVDSSGALSLGLWPALPGLWAERKSAEFDKFAQVEAWVDALLQLAAPVLGAGAVISAAGGTASGVAGAGASGAASSGPAGAAGSGGGVLAGTAGVSGALGIGTVAAAGSAPVAAVSGTLAGAGGLGAGVHSGTAGATTGLGTGTAAAVYPTPAAAVDPDAIAAAIATALGTRLDALGSRIASLEARGAAPAGASLLSGGVAPPEAELLARALRDSVATVEGWDVARCSLACADLVHEAAKLRPQLTLRKEIHPFGKLPMKALEANAFPTMVYALPELAAEECELNELPTGKEATQEHWRAFVHLLQARVGEFQHFVKSKVPSYPLTDVMVASFFKKRKRVQGQSTRTGWQGLFVVNSLPKTSSALQPVQRLQQEDEGRIKWKDGDLTVVPKTKTCKDMDEWERGFFRIMCEAPAEARDDLVDFLAWAKTIASDFTFYHFSEFYEHLIPQVQRSTIGISLEGYDRVWRVYQQQHRLQPRVKKKRNDYKWNRDGAQRQQQQQQEQQPQTDNATLPSAVLSTILVQVTTGDAFDFRSQEAPAGAVEVPVVVPGPAVEMDMAPMMETEDEGEATLVERARGEREMEVPTDGMAPERWRDGLRSDEFIPVWDVLGGPRRHDRVPLRWEVERIAPLPVTQTSPDAWR